MKSRPSAAPKNFLHCVNTRGSVQTRHPCSVRGRPWLPRKPTREFEYRERAWFLLKDQVRQLSASSAAGTDRRASDRQALQMSHFDQWTPWLIPRTGFALIETALELGPSHWTHQAP